jgi:hypothetical protein
MSLDTVLQIGKAFRNSENNLKYFKYVESCPKDKDGNWPICITIPVKSDFSFDWNNITFTPENKRDTLYYLKFKPSNNDSSAKKYLFGDIYYVRNSEVNKKKISEFGNYILAKNAFENGLKLYEEISQEIFSNSILPLLVRISDEKMRQNVIKAIIKKYTAKKEFNLPKSLNEYTTLVELGVKQIKLCVSQNSLIQFHLAFEKEIELFNRILNYAPACKLIMDNDKAKIKEFISDENKLKDKYIQALFEKEGLEDKSKLKGFLQKNEAIDTLTEETKNKIIQYSDFSVFIHFDFFEEKLNWYQIEDAFTDLKQSIYAKITSETEKGLVPSKTIYRTLCSGNDSNDIQYPEFDKVKAYRSFVFQNQEEFNDFLHTGKILDTPLHMLHKTKIGMFVFPVAFYGETINAEQYDGFFEKKNENLLNKLSLWGESEWCNKFDFILSDSSGKATRDLIEISGIERSNLKSISKRIKNIAIEINEERKNVITTNNDFLGIEESLLNILGTYIINKNGYLDVNENHRYKSHLVRILPLIYMQNYHTDEILLSSFIKNMENIIRLVKEKVSRYKYNSLIYDLKFLFSIQNNKNNKYMEIIDSESYQIGVNLGKLAKPIKKKINSFEKKYVGLLTRHVSSKDDCIRFVNDISEMLVRQEKMWGQLATETIEKLVSIPKNEYEKEKVALGFFEGYFKYEVNDDKNQFISKIERIISDYEGKDDFQGEIQTLRNTLEEIKETF